MIAYCASQNCQRKRKFRLDAGKFSRTGSKIANAWNRRYRVQFYPIYPLCSLITLSPLLSIQMLLLEALYYRYFVAKGISALGEEISAFFSRLRSPTFICLQQRASSDISPVHKLPLQRWAERLSHPILDQRKEELLLYSSILLFAANRLSYSSTYPYTIFMG